MRQELHQIRVYSPQLIQRHTEALLEVGDQSLDFGFFYRIRGNGRRIFSTKDSQHEGPSLFGLEHMRLLTTRFTYREMKQCVDEILDLAFPVQKAQNLFGCQMLPPQDRHW